VQIPHQTVTQLGALERANEHAFPWAITPKVAAIRNCTLVLGDTFVWSGRKLAVERYAVCRQGFGRTCATNGELLPPRSRSASVRQ